jgi:hypothetical protein
MEAFNGTLKVECVHGEHFRTREEACQAIVEFIGYYNTERRHSKIGNISPALYEQRWHEAQQKANVGNRHRRGRQEVRGAAHPPRPRANRGGKVMKANDIQSTNR